MTHFRTSIEPSLLVWARESIGYSQIDAARKIGVAEATLASWESGDSAPTINQLRKAADVYKRPLAVFYLSTPPRDFDAMRDFRRIPSSGPSGLSPVLIAELRRAHLQREVAIELASLAGEPPLTIDLRLLTTQSADEAGMEIREWLGIDIEQQVTWQNRYEALNKWITAIEAKGILVCQISKVAVEEMRGCAIGTEPFPVVVLNGKDSPRGRLFTLLHELVHVLLGDGGICDLHDESEYDRSQGDGVELFCNRVASSTLMPAGEVRDYIRRLFGSGRQAWNDEQLALLSTAFGPSREAVLRRLVSLGYASMAQYLSVREQYARGFAEHEQNLERSGADFYRVQVRNLGRNFVSRVLDAYDNERISSAEASRLLGVKLEKIPTLASRL